MDFVSFVVCFFLFLSVIAGETAAVLWRDCCDSIADSIADSVADSIADFIAGSIADSIAVLSGIIAKRLSCFFFCVLSPFAFACRPLSVDRLR